MFKYYVVVSIEAQPAEVAMQFVREMLRVFFEYTALQASTPEEFVLNLVRDVIDAEAFLRVTISNLGDSHYGPGTGISLEVYNDGDTQLGVLFSNGEKGCYASVRIRQDSWGLADEYLAVELPIDLEEANLPCQYFTKIVVEG